MAEEHLSTLQANGFDLQYDDTAAPGSRIVLRAHPVVAGVALGPTDLDELLAQLSLGRTLPSHAASNTSKARAALAMRACRSSLMVGTPLRHERMQRVVAGLAGLDMPWNCPHGRPTMRHLLDLHDPALGLQDDPPTPVNWVMFAEQE